MKVVHMCWLPLPQDHPDYERRNVHPGRWVLDLARAQKKFTEIEPEIVTQTSSSKNYYYEEIEGIPVHYLPAPARFRSLTLFQFDRRRIAKKVLDLKPDLVHGHGTEDAYGLAAIQTGKPYVLTAQGTFYVINEYIPFPLFSRGRVVMLMEHRCLARTKYVITKSTFIENKLKQKYPHLECIPIPNTFDPSILDICEEKEKNTLVFVGSIVPLKGMHILRDAIGLIKAKIPDLRLWVLGNSKFPSAYEVEQVELLKKMLGPNVNFLGTLPQIEALRYVARASLLVAPSFQEMFGNQVIEALLLKTHAIVADGTAIAESVHRFGNGTVVKTGDPVELGKAISCMLSQVTFPEAEEAKKRIVQNCSPEVVAIRHAEIYKKILGK